MKKYAINHTETYFGQFIIEAESEDEAMKIFVERFLPESMSWMEYDEEDTELIGEVPSYTPTTIRN